jgi:hypothetical protein
MIMGIAHTYAKKRRYSFALLLLLPEGATGTAHSVRDRLCRLLSEGAGADA